MNFYFNSLLGGIHTISAIIALLVGPAVLLNKKGTPLHKKLGYFYVVAVLVLNLTSIAITNLFGTIGPFHIFTAVSLFTIFSGMYFPLFGRRVKDWVFIHLELMLISYVGLVSAAIAEIMIRVPLAIAVDSRFTYVILIFVFSGVSGGIGYYFVYRYKKRFSS